MTALITRPVPAQDWRARTSGRNGNGPPWSSPAVGRVKTSEETDADAWEFPLLLKYKFGGPNAIAASVRPFVTTGASFRRLTNISQVGSFITGSAPSTPTELQDKNSTGFVVGGGVEIRALFLRISPEVRFTRWGTANFLEGVSNLLETNRNQGQFLVGIHF